VLAVTIAPDCAPALAYNAVISTPFCPMASAYPISAARRLARLPATAPRLAVMVAMDPACTAALAVRVATDPLIDPRLA
jgi:hypothetical protein